jgi:pimeloyl-ACP methyl ester carboxylesterase
MNVDRFAVVGFSWGGTVGARIAPERLRALVLVLVDAGYQSCPGLLNTAPHATARRGMARGC